MKEVVRIEDARLYVASEVIRKIKNIEPITNEDLDELQRILWEELGTQEEYYLVLCPRAFYSIHLDY
jgi:type I site-specific restriction endonuclease